MKRKISLILIFLLICIVCLAGCGSSGNSSSNGTATNTDTNLADNINEIFQSGTYQMDITTIVDNEGEAYEVNMVLAVDGDNMAGETTMQGMKMNFIIKDGKYYMINHDQKMVLTFAYDSSDTSETIEVPSVEELNDDMTFAKRSNVEIDGEALVCEEYTISSEETVKYYFKNNTLVRMEIISGAYTQIMKINEIKGTVDSELFEIPSNYQQMSM